MLPDAGIHQKNGRKVSLIQVCNINSNAQAPVKPVQTTLIGSPEHKPGAAVCIMNCAENHAAADSQYIPASTSRTPQAQRLANCMRPTFPKP